MGGLVRPGVWWWLAATVLAGVMSADARSQAAERAEPLKGLLVTGGCCHDYASQKRIITEGLSQRINIVWDVVHEGGTSRTHKVSIYHKPDWSAGYDVVVHNECFGGVADDAFLENIVRGHRDTGVAAVFIHCALHSYRSAPKAVEQWRELIGVSSKSHERHRSVLVKNLRPTHPVMRGFPRQWQTPNGELYKIFKVWPNCTPLAEAFGQDTQQNHTVVWVNTCGKARVFGTSLGHHNETMNNDVWLGLVARGTLWACGKLRDDGTPQPGYEGTGIRPIVLGPLRPQTDPQFRKRDGAAKPKKRN
ncbi:MAG: ThuA domain-containing protein [Planctomycetota bacterium]|nr:MAG: ThuA domain-containing protein [Planctomycetota bacterium]